MVGEIVVVVIKTQVVGMIVQKDGLVSEEEGKRKLDARRRQQLLGRVTVGLPNAMSSGGARFRAGSFGLGRISKRIPT